MSNTKTVMSQAANTLTTPLNVEDVFSTYLYEGNGSTQTITNGIDLDGEGGLVWIKERNNPTSHQTFNTEVGLSGTGSRLITNDNIVPSNSTRYLSSVNSDGFSIGDENDVNRSTGDYASWTFRKAPKFFDVVTYTGTGSAQTIAHSLGSTPGTIIIKGTDYVENWIVYHRSLGATKYIQLNTTGAASTSSTTWNDTAPTSTEFTVNTLNAVNESGYNYVAYLFAHNDGDGEFGPDGDADIIKCGSWAGTGSEQTIDLGFEPQWVLMKDTEAASNWFVVDNMRGMSASGNWVSLHPNSSSIEETLATGFGPQLVSNGIKLLSTDTNFNSTSRNIIYIAIRRGTKVPESGTEVFDASLLSSTFGMEINTNFSVDMLISTTPANTQDNWLNDRMRGSRLSGPTQFLKTNNTDAEYTFASGGMGFDNNSGFTQNWWSGTTEIYWSWKRAPNFFDVVAYTGNGTAGRTVSHNLGVAPEMMWVKRRDATDNWFVYHSGMNDVDKHFRMNLANAASTSTTRWNSTAPASTEFTVGTDSGVNASGGTYIAYLFASLDGVSKVGSYTGNGTSQTIDCGFTSGSRFILVKRTDSTGDWYVWDTERGIVAGNDPYLELNTTDAEVTSTDWVDPDNSGFIVNGTTINASSAEYIFYAIA